MKDDLKERSILVGEKIVNKKKKEEKISISKYKGKVDVQVNREKDKNETKMQVNVNTKQVTRGISWVVGSLVGGTVSGLTLTAVLTGAGFVVGGPAGVSVANKLGVQPNPFSMPRNARKVEKSLIKEEKKLLKKQRKLECR